MKLNVICLMCLVMLLGFMAGCLGEDQIPVEGDEPGECTDGTDNDQDGVVDCADDGCAVDVTCTGDDDDTAGDDDDTAGDDDDTAGDDDDSAGDDDSSGDDDDTGGDDDDTGGDDDTAGPDDDGDGYVASSAGGTDCDDANPTVSPAALELCDGVDNDCDGSVDEEAIDGLTWHLDSDSDGYGGQLLSQEACSPPSSYVDNTDDCDDLESGIYPGATELCNGIDDDCDGDIDDNAPAAQTWYLDNDGDGVGGFWLTQEACDMPLGYAPDSSDCDDTNASVYPLAPELCDGSDNDCDGNLGGDEIDNDGDGFTECSQDCDDANALRFPGSAELCDGIDNDCDAATIAGDGETDDDGDSVLNCDDCDDDPTTGPGVYPGAAEVCDGIDNDCDGTVDVGASDESTWYFDADGDTHGGFLLTQQACTAPTGYVSSSDDCAELDPNSYPGAPEVCDGVDNDCNGQIDDGSGAAGTTWYADTDADGYGDPGTQFTACVQPAGFVSNSVDCDDGNSATNPGAYEICDGLDNNCVGGIDETGALNASLWYVDADGDGYGRLSTTISSCNQPTGYADNAADCDDNDGANAPGNIELCDGQDNDCSGAADFDATGEVDLDVDGSPSCVDCDDADAANQPGGTELCDGQDNDCNAGPDMDLAGEVDVDADGSLSCEDCDDNDGNNVPGGTEVCDGQDNDCTSGADFDSAGEVDADSDGSFSCADCDDDPATGSDSYPGNTEVCEDGTDQDCNGLDAPCFTQVGFTTCSQSGRTGPVQSQCNSAYLGTDLAGDVTLSSGVQSWIVPLTATFRITVLGAGGGSTTNSSDAGAQGTSMRGDFSLTQGQVLQVLVGQQGTGWGYTSGGGGGSYVGLGSNYSSATPLIVAGGGGGGGDSGGNGYDASTGESGVTGHPNYGAGSGGNGNSNDTNGGWGSGGAGFYGNGTSPYTGSRAQSFRNGGAGSTSHGSCCGSCNGAPGGFGGGGSGACNGGGGGGGYSGGGQGGGGGGSYNDGVNQSNQANANSSNGQVTITLAN